MEDVKCSNYNEHRFHHIAQLDELLSCIVKVFYLHSHRTY